MVQAMREHPALGQDAEARRALEKYGGSKGRKRQVAGAVPFRVSLSPFEYQI
jgi:hypothetical protein